MPRPAGIVERIRQVTLDQPETLGDGDCEALRAGLIGQPTNTLSSLAFVGVGAWLAARVGELPDASRRGALAYASFTAITGIGSVAYHGPQFVGAQFLHDLPILGVFGVGAFVPLWRLRNGRAALPGWSSGRGLAIVAAGTVAGLAYLAGGTESPLCQPESLLQPHGLWHLGTAAVIALWGATVWAPPSEPLRSEPSADATDEGTPAVAGVDGVDDAER
jgi:hypothetical protein